MTENNEFVQPSQSPVPSARSSKRITRSRDQRMIAGVSGGIAEYFGIDPTIVRLAWVVSAFLGGAGVVAYAVAWVIIPEA